MAMWLLDQDDQVHVALAEIELCCELMIAASATAEERLSSERIDEVLKVEPRVPAQGRRRG
ncbi:hypothetical protein ACIP98_23710 [Streptomyces sp. NPDC088354]|uniref:hypothetical protein n=1 Tax=unclassified Streptomyces TaxID=2593676 RepID=UPI0029B7714E|nr:hypothetical protein [Streptomyces sp. MI02-7b]MDX3076458.1 hypothetical protein [Streptomyces sp. MI02-7b]